MQKIKFSDLTRDEIIKLLSGMPLEDMKDNYPNFTDWWQTKVIPEMILGSRNGILYYKNDILDGISIVKPSENKICLLRTFGNFKGEKLSYEIFKDSIDLLEVEKPYITISDTNIEKYRKQMKYFGFEIMDFETDRYIKGKTEYFINNVE